MLNRQVVTVVMFASLGCAAHGTARTPVGAFTHPDSVATREGWATADDGLRLYFRVYGTGGDTLIYLHGGPGGNAGRQMPNLLPLAIRHVVVAYDQRAGNGRSGVGDTLLLSPERHVADLEAVRQAIGAPRVSLFGHSWGGALAILYADRHAAHVRRLIINGPMPPARIPFDAERNDSVRARIGARCAAGAASPDSAAVRQCRQQPVAAALVYWADTANLARDRGRQFRAPGGPGASIGNRVTLRALGDWDFRPVMQRVRVPALIVEGAQSPVPFEHLRIWARTLPNARLLRIEGAGHGYAYIEQPEAFFRGVEEFLSGRWPTGSARP